jgi:hypothetical protein
MDTRDTRWNVTGYPSWNLKDEYGGTDGMADVLLKGESTCTGGSMDVCLTFFPVSADAGTHLPPTLTLPHVPVEQVDDVLHWVEAWFDEALIHQPTIYTDRKRSFLRAVRMASRRDELTSDLLRDVRQKSLMRRDRDTYTSGNGTDETPRRELSFSELETERARVARVRAKIVMDAIENDPVYKKDCEDAEEIWAEAYRKKFGV